jgi:hypothetical protein
VRLDERHTGHVGLGVRDGLEGSPLEALELDRFGEVTDPVKTLNEAALEGGGADAAARLTGGGGGGSRLRHGRGEAKRRGAPDPGESGDEVGVI